MKKSIFSGLAPILLLMFMAGCASLQPGYEKPSVSITSFEALPTEGMVPKFRIGLHIVNPNRTPLDLKGVSYSIFIEDHKIMTGVSNQFSSIEAYGEGDIILNAAVDLFSSIQFFTSLISNKNTDRISYRFSAKLDAGSLHPLIRVSREGVISLAGPAAQ